MAFVRAVKSGNWSDPTVWHTGTLPTSGDTVYSNTFTVTIDQDVLIGHTNDSLVNAGSFIAGQLYEIVEQGDTSFTSIGANANTPGTVFFASGVGSGTGVAKTVACITNYNNTAAGASSGGTFNLSGNFNIWAAIIPQSVTSLNVTGTAQTTIIGRTFGNISNLFPSAIAINYTGTGSINFIGNIYVARAYGINKTSSGSITVTGDLWSQAGGYNSSAIYYLGTASGNTTITGNVFAGAGNGGHGIRIDSGASGNFIITGDIYGSTNGSTAYGINNAATVNITVTGNVYGGTGSLVGFTGGAGIFNRGTLTVTGNVFANISVGIFSDSVNSTNQLNGSAYDNPVNGVVAVYARKFNNFGIPVQAVRQKAIDGVSTTVTYYTVDNNVFDYAAISDVRDGVSYANGNLTGICKIPSPNNVMYNTPTDNTVGTAVLKPENVWDYLKNNIDTEGSIGERLKNAVTVNDMGKLLIDTLT